MLEKESEFLLNYIVKEVGSAYKIIEYSDIILSFPPSYTITEEKLKEALLILKNKDYISVKYNDGKSVCLCSTEKAFLYKSNLDKTTSEKEIKESKLFGISFLGGLIGGFLGALILSFIVVALGG
jgi:hypothetical protein